MLPRAATLAVCCLLAAPAAALADTGLGAASSFLWQRSGDGDTLSGPSAITTVPGSTNAIVAGQVLREVADEDNPGQTVFATVGVVRRFSPTGALLSEFALPRGPFWTTFPRAVAASPDGSVYVAAEMASFTQTYVGVRRYDAGTGAELARFAETDPAGLAFVSEVDVAPDGTVYVFGRTAVDPRDRVAVYSPAGVYQSHFDPPLPPDVYDEGYGPMSRLFGLDPRDESVLAVTTLRCGSARRMRFDRFTAAGAPAGAAAGLPFAGLDDVEIRPGDGTIYASSQVDGITVLDQHGGVTGTREAVQWRLAVSGDGSRLWNLMNHWGNTSVESLPAAAPTGAAAPLAPCAPPLGGDETRGGGGGGRPGPALPPQGWTAPGPARPRQGRTAPGGAGGGTPFDVAAEAARARAVVARLRRAKLGRKGYSRPFRSDRAGIAVEELLVRGKVVARGSVAFRAAGVLRLRVKPTRAARKSLRRGKRVRVTIRTAFQPAGAARVIAAERVTLQRR